VGSSLAALPVWKRLLVPFIVGNRKFPNDSPPEGCELQRDERRGKGNHVWVVDLGIITSCGTPDTPDQCAFNRKYTTTDHPINKSHGIKTIRVVILGQRRRPTPIMFSHNTWSARARPACRKA
jgi:hypothetical protein